MCSGVFVGSKSSKDARKMPLCIWYTLREQLGTGFFVLFRG